MKPRRVPFSLLLILVSLMTWIQFAVLTTAWDFVALEQQAHLAAPRSHAQLLALAASYGTLPYARLINGIDLPANFIELPVDRFLPTWPDTWHPNGLTVFEWRTFTFPFFSLPFWWFAGLGIDAALRHRNPRWPALLTGTILCLLFLILAIGFSVTIDAKDDLATQLPIDFGVCLWTALFGTFPFAWIRNLRTARKLKRRPSVA